DDLVRYVPSPPFLLFAEPSPAAALVTMGGRAIQVLTISTLASVPDAIRLPTMTVATRPNTSTAIDVENASDQFPVQSTSPPITTGDMIPAIPKPKFMMPLAVPDCCGIRSIGSDHIGDTMSSRKKKATLSSTAAVTRSDV